MSANELAPWRSALSRALHRNRSAPFSRYFQLATVTSDGLPANRTVVFRGFADNCDQLKFISDRRSTKFQDFEHQPWGAICWYFTKTREQFRITGRLAWVDAETEDAIAQAERRTQWETLSENARTQFAWPHPAQARAEAEAFTVTTDPQQICDPFVLVYLEPVRVDHLELRGEPQSRYVYIYEQSHWQMQSVNP